MARSRRVRGALAAFALAALCSFATASGCSSNGAPADGGPDVIAKPDSSADAGCNATIAPSTWTKLVTGPSAYAMPTGMVIDSSGRIFVTGDLHGSMDFGNGPLAGAGINDSIFVAAWDASGAPLWSTLIGDALEETTASIALVPSGGVFVTAPLYDATKMDASFQGGLALVRFDETGKTLWSKVFASSDAASVAVAQDGSIVLAGEAEHTFDLGGCSVGPAPAGDGGAASSRPDVFVAKLDASGTCTWGKSFGDASGQAARAVALDGAGNIVLAGAYTGTLDFGGASTPLVGPADPDPTGFGPLGTTGVDLFLAELDSTGVGKWSKSFGDGAKNTDNGVRTLALGPNGAIALGVFSTGQLDFGGGAVSGSECTLAAFDSTGAYRFAHAVHAFEDPILGALAFDASGNLYATGALPSQADFGAGNVPADSFSYKGDGIFVVSWDPSGKTRSGTAYPGCPAHSGPLSEGSALAFDPSGALVVAGYFDYFLDTSGGTGDTFVLAKTTP